MAGAVGASRAAAGCSIPTLALWPSVAKLGMVGSDTEFNTWTTGHGDQPYWIAYIRAFDESLAYQDALLELGKVGSIEQSTKLRHEIEVDTHVRRQDRSQQQFAEERAGGRTIE